MKTSGYSGTPLAKKLGINPGFKVKLVDQPEHYFALFTDMPADIVLNAKDKLNFIHYFTKEAKPLEKSLIAFRKELVPDGMIWVSWPKKASKVPTDVTEDLIREIALKNGLVDIKVCAVDDVWSGLKLVIPVKDR
jgi:hypothetical protein